MSEPETELAQETFANPSMNLIVWVNQFSNELAKKIYVDTNLSHPQILTYVTIFTTSVALVVIASYATIEKPKNALKPSKSHPLFDPSDLDTRLDEEETITERKALSIPLVAGGTLLALYYGLQNISKETFVFYMKWYFVTVLGLSNFNTLDYLIKAISRKRSSWFELSPLSHFKLTISKDEEFNPFGVEEFYDLPESTRAERIIREEKLLTARSTVLPRHQIFNFYYSTFQLIALPASVLASYAYHKIDTGNWLVSNAAASSLVIFGVQNARITNFRSGALMLAGLFFYDIYFVFGSSVMETVALGMDYPVKLSIPNGAKVVDGESIGMAILGVGDIVVPSVFISLCLRFDLWKFHELNEGYEFHHLHKYSKPYFISALLGYSIALIATFSALEVYSHGQPALLYIVPSVLSSVFVTAIFKGDLKTLLKFEEIAKDGELLHQGGEYKISAETLRLLESDAEGEDDEDEDYVYDEDTVIVMDQYLDHDETDSEEEAVVTNEDIFSLVSSSEESDSDAEEEQAENVLADPGDINYASYLASLPESSSEEEDDDFVADE